MNISAETLIQILQQTVEREKTGGMDAQGAIRPYGANAEMTWSQFKNARQNGYFQNVRVKESSTVVGNLGSAPLYGCSGIFGICGPDEIIGLSMQDDPLVEWLGFFPDTICEKFIKGWTYTDVAGTAAGSPVGNVYGDACDDPPTSEKGICEFFIGDFGTLRACGEAVRVADIGLRKCDKQPTYTIPIEGIGPIRLDNDLDMETITGAQTVKHELSRLLITGDKQVAGQFDGLTNLVRTGYTSIDGKRCKELDSWVVDWENDLMTGLVNGHGSIITKIRDMFRQIMWRVLQTGMGRPSEGDMVLVMPSWLAWQLLDEWAVWSFVEQVNAQQVVYRDYMDVRALRDKYAGGLYGGGYITIDNFNLHIIMHDWMPIDQAAPKFCSDIYLLTRRIGGRRVLQGQYVPVDMGANAVNALAGFSYFTSEAVQGGRALRFLKYQNACVQPCILQRPRTYLETPWAQGVIQNVCVTPQFEPQTADPQGGAYFFGSLTKAEKSTQYWYNSDSTSWFS